MAIININKSDFEALKNSDKTVLIDFYADWCGPCKMVAPILHEIAEENPQYEIAKVNVDIETALAIEFGVQSIPTMVVMKNGKITNKAIGFRSKEQILELLK